MTFPKIPKASIYQLTVAFVATVAVPAFLWLFSEAESDLKQHGLALSRISESLVGLKEGQARVESMVNSRFGEIARDQDEMRSEVDRLQQASDDAAREMMPRRVSPN